MIPSPYMARRVRDTPLEEKPAQSMLGRAVAYHCEAGQMGGIGEIIQHHRDDRGSIHVLVKWHDTGELQWYGRPGQYGLLTYVDDEWETP